MLPWLSRPGANPSATHPAGREAARAVQRAREQVAALIGARRAADIVFTSCGSESTATAFHAARHRRTAPAAAASVISAAEHSATKKAAAARFGDAVTTVPVDAGGALDRDALRAELAAGDVAIVSVILLNETGVISDLDGLGEECRAAGALLHVDAVQAPAKTPSTSSASAATSSGSRATSSTDRGRRRAPRLGRHRTASLIVGGPQEGERRAGTENVPGIVGFGVAAERAAERGVRGGSRRDLGAARPAGAPDPRRCPGSSVNGDPARRAPNTTNIGFDLAPPASTPPRSSRSSTTRGSRSARDPPATPRMAPPRCSSRWVRARHGRLRPAPVPGPPGHPDATSMADVERCAAAVSAAHAQVQAWPCDPARERLGRTQGPEPGILPSRSTHRHAEAEDLHDPRVRPDPARPRRPRRGGPGARPYPGLPEPSRDDRQGRLDAREGRGPGVPAPAGTPAGPVRLLDRGPRVARRHDPARLHAQDDRDVDRRQAHAPRAAGGTRTRLADRRCQERGGRPGDLPVARQERQARDLPQDRHGAAALRVLHRRSRHLGGAAPACWRPWTAARPRLVADRRLPSKRDQARRSARPTPRDP